MKIKSVVGGNVKGLTFVSELSGVDVFIGNNASGKTAVLDTVKVALLGYHPMLGKRGSDTVKLASGPTMSCGLKFGNDAGIVRMFKPGKSASETVTEGPVPSVPPVLLDLRTYFDMTKAERTRYVFERAHVPDGEVTGESLASKVRVGLADVEADPEHKERVIADATNIIMTFADAAAEEDVRPQVWIQTVIDQMRVIAKDASAESKRLAGLLQASVTLRDGGIPVNRDEDLRRATEVLRDTDNRITAYKHVIDEWLRWQRNVEVLQAKADAAAVGNDEAITVLTQKAEALRQAAEKLRAELGPDPAGKVVEARTMINILTTQIREASATLANAQRKLDEVQNLDCCPFCRSKRKGWREELEAIYKADIDTLKAGIEQKTRERDVFSSSLKGLQDSVDARMRNDQKVRELESEARRIDTEAATERRRAEVALITKSELSAVLAAKPWTGESIDEARLNLASQEEVRGKYLTVVNTLESQQREYIRWTQEQIQRERALDENAKATAKATVMKRAADILLEEQGRLIDLVVTRLLEPARMFTDDLLAGRLDYRDGDFGYWSGATWVSHETFSGAERAIAYAGISVALAQDSECKVVIMDELGVMDTGNRWRFLCRMVELVDEGVIDNFIGADASPIQGPPGCASHLISNLKEGGVKC